MAKKITKILVANRGEIAIRVMRSCREMGIGSVAVYSDADKNAVHTRYADEAIALGGNTSAESYLKADLIIEIAKKVGADAIHPGYGFLSENADFARKLAANNIILIGPSAESMEVMGSKIESKQAVAKFGVPLVPGINEAIKNKEDALEIAKEVGFPVLVKASAGGGGKGMRIVNHAEDFFEALETAQNEARNSFGDDAVFIEKFVDKPRHIEFQILADNHGNVVHLMERECSIQRRHQKLVEEAPCPIMTDDLRSRMGEAAVNVAKACNYSGAGTVEFLVGADGNFYFLEMNTRLQVEHPVTELITNLDLVKEQIKVAQDEKLAFAQEDIKINGHAFELRVCAEDPYNNFLPNIGKIGQYVLPQGPGVRVDDCMEANMDIPIYYDNMVAKLIVHAPTREQGIQRMLRAISEYKITGIQTTLGFGNFVFTHPKFIEGDFDTNFIAAYFSGKHDELNLSDEEVNVLSMVAANLNKNENNVEAGEAQAEASKWQNRRTLR
jgi:acetyl-CoA carboxylase, biotin carboxylase subunit